VFTLPSYNSNDVIIIIIYNYYLLVVVKQEAEQEEETGGRIVYLDPVTFVVIKGKKIY
jgi:hypothetical protein